GPAELPHAMTAGRPVRRPGRVDRVEVRAGRRVDAAIAGEPVAVPAEVRRLDPRQVGFEGDTLVVSRAVEERAREHDRAWVVLLVLPTVRVRPSPHRLVRRAVEVVVGCDTAS